MARPRYRPAPFAEVENSAVWWTALALLGALIVLGGGFAAALGDFLAVGGVALFFVTAGLAGAERLELATTAGAAGMIWTATGISIALGTDGSTFATGLGFVAFGGGVLALAGTGAHRLRGRTKRISRPAG